ncbi:MAG: DUF2452 domain-containing protein [Bacteroidota bacterium]
MSETEEKRTINPIDPDKIAQDPHLLPYAHSVGGAIIRPIDKGRTKGVAMSAMYEQTSTSLHQIKDQVEHLLAQAQEIHDRIDVSEKIYLADCSFKPVIGQEYQLYEKSDGSWILSMVTPAEWGANPPYYYLASARLLHDHTWEILKLNNDKPIFEV